MSTISTSRAGTETKATSEVLISSDSHVMEDRNLWMERLPARLKERAASFGFGGERTGDKPGGHDPKRVAGHRPGPAHQRLGDRGDTLVSGRGEIEWH